MSEKRKGNLRQRIRRLVGRQRPRLYKIGSGIQTYAEPCKNSVETIFFVLAIAWALYVFVYTDRYKPSVEHPQVVPTAQLERAGQKGKAVALAARVKVKNTGKVKVKIVSAFFNVLGYMVVKREEDCPYTDVLKDDLANAMKHSWEMHMTRYYKRDGKRPLQCGNILLGSWLEPGEEYERVFTVYVPEGLDLVRMKLDIWMARDTAFISRRSVGEKVRSEWYIDEQDGTLNSKLSINNCTFCFTDNWQPLDAGDESHGQFLDKHGIFHGDSAVDLSLW
jgi:hypothetical protein